MREPSLERAQGMMGFLAKDVVTGFTGVVTAVTEFAYGCAHVTLEPERIGKDNEQIQGFSFDEPRIEVIERRPVTNDIAMPKYKVGYILEDKINGQKGFVGAITIWLFGIPDYGMEPTDLRSDGGVNKVFYLAEGRANLVEESAPKFVEDPKAGSTKTPERRPGGPRDEAPQHRRSATF